MSSPDAQIETIPSLIAELRVLRERRGVTYRELATTIAQQREAAGARPEAARIAHTTVADVFRAGRTRVNANLVVEIVRALGGDDAECERWRERIARRAVAVAPPASRPSPAAHPARVVVPSPPRSASETKLSTSTVAHPRAVIVLLLLAGVIVNSAGKFINPLLGDVLFLDMIGTATVALIAGPWIAALLGLVFVAVELLKGQFGDALFAVTMITAGLIWGGGARWFGMGRTLARFAALSAIVAVVTTAIAAPVTVLVLGQTNRGLDSLYALAAEGFAGAWQSVTVVNLAVSLIDKVLTGVIAYWLARSVWRFFASGEAPFGQPRAARYTRVG